MWAVCLGFYSTPFLSPAGNFVLSVCLKKKQNSFAISWEKYILQDNFFFSPLACHSMVQIYSWHSGWQITQHLYCKYASSYLSVRIWEQFLQLAITAGIVSRFATSRRHFCCEMLAFFSSAFLILRFLSLFGRLVLDTKRLAGPGYQNLSRGPDWKWPNREARGAMFWFGADEKQTKTTATENLQPLL